ncbi:hypothetical protein CYJ38_02400 [Bifidobacterium breve]|nr:hypothetical protein BBL520_09880 [Bifidobacterium breve]AZI17363.1 hypothetical protein EH245_09525 [Bifidobacterium breve]MBD3902803.1 hypothetical protein [Bifidobacterium breve]MBD9020096.1 hypothetical protein [Bifidobacterium breve]OPG85627.1 hypothetical protein B5D08_09135 [Bifidobacterium breve]
MLCDLTAQDCLRGCVKYLCHNLHRKLWSGRKATELAKIQRVFTLVCWESVGSSCRMFVYVNESCSIEHVVVGLVAVATRRKLQRTEHNQTSDGFETNVLIRFSGFS